VSVFRSPSNPIIEPKDVGPSRDDFEVIGVFNAGVTRLKDEVILLLRVAEKPISPDPTVALAALYDVSEGNIVLKKFPKDDPENDFSDPRLIVAHGATYLTSISHVKLARSENGIDFEIDEAAAIGAANEYEIFGIEDPRISLIEGIYYVNYVAVSPLGVTTCLASTKDFKDFRRHGVIFCPENKDVVLFPERIAGKYYAIHRPTSPLFQRNEIWLAESSDLRCWGNHRYLMGLRAGFWDEKKIGASAVPVRIDRGWLEIYHGVDPENRYCLGTVLLDAEHPWKVIARSDQPIFEPQADYECEGFFGNVVFSCGLLYEDNKLKIYYGAADTTICYAELGLEDVLGTLKAP
jgi:predicted GH43/DUF377 family glycosyl hydrolase